MHNNVGRPVQGEDFFDREAEQRQLWRRLETDNVLLLAPRRVGKTSLMYCLRDTAELHGFEAIYTSVSDVKTEIAFIQRLFSSLSELSSTENIFSKLTSNPIFKRLSQVKKVGGAGFSLEFTDSDEEQWAEIGEALAREINNLNQPLLLLVDEVPVFVLNIIKEDPSGKRAREFLYWLRQLRQDYKNLQWLIAGSIGLDTVTARLNIGDTINDLNIQQLGPFTKQSANTFLIELGNSYKIELSPEICSYIISRIDWLIPFHLQLIFSELRDISNEMNEKITKEIIDNSFEILLSPSKKGYFDYWRQRLHDELGKPDASGAIALLNTVVSDENGASHQTLHQVLIKIYSEQSEEKLRYLLDILENDGYLVNENSRYYFRSNLLKEYWKRRVMK
jgi:uncharacterized protein